jgi:DNA polymerase-1
MASKRIPRTLIIDGDIIAYQSAAAGMTRIDWGDGSDPTVTSDDEYVEHNTRTRMQTIMSACTFSRFSDTIVVAFSCPGRRYWKHRLFPGYKAGRSTRPPGIALAKKILRDNFATHLFEYPGCEADDVMGIYASHLQRSAAVTPIVVSTDKDMRQIEGCHLNPDKIDEGVYEISWRDAAYHHIYQTLVGDSCDTYPGCPGIGDVKARHILAAALENCTFKHYGNPKLYRRLLWRGAVKAYRDRGLTPKDALLQARVAYIPDCDHWNGKRIKLWRP